MCKSTQKWTFFKDVEMKQSSKSIFSMEERIVFLGVTFQFAYLTLKIIMFFTEFALM